MLFLLPILFITTQQLVLKKKYGHTESVIHLEAVLTGLQEIF